MLVNKSVSDYTPSRCTWANSNPLWTDEPLSEISEQLRLLCLTWNMKGKPTPEMLSDVLITSAKHHIYLISTQECLRPIALSVFYSQMRNWEEKVTEVLGKEYVLLASDSVGGTHLMMISHVSLASRFTEIQINTLATGFFNCIPNKGGIGISFVLNSKRFLAIGCHLTSGERKMKERNEDLKRILNNFERNQVCDCVIALGDFNYRVIGTGREVGQLIVSKERTVLLKMDQLLGEMRGGRVAFDYKEGDIEFQPTFKLHKGSYDLSRVPSWTDRIIFKDKRGLLCQHVYNSISNAYSDHFPVFSQFTLNL